MCWYLLYSLSVPLVHMLFLYTRSFHLLSGSLLATTHCWSALTIIHFHILWLITQPTRCLLPMDPLIIYSESCETLSDVFLTTFNCVFTLYWLFLSLLSLFLLAIWDLFFKHMLINIIFRCRIYSRLCIYSHLLSLWLEGSHC